jgi:ribosomal protein L24
MQGPKWTPVEHHLKGDKIRIRTGVEKGRRGSVVGTDGEHLEVLLKDGRTVRTSSQDITNYSLAARKAWKTMKSQ